MQTFFDCFYIGEGETQYDTFLNLYKSMRASGQYSRKAFLHEAAKIEGIYVPSLYEVRYKEDGTIAAFTPVYDDIPATIKKQVDMDLTGSFIRKTGGSIYQSNTGSRGA
mgnify:CR=1 FL=1